MQFRKLTIAAASVLAVSTLAACVSTQDEAIKAGGKILDQNQVQSEFSEQQFSGSALGHPVTFAFKSDGSFTGMAAKSKPLGGKWQAKNSAVCFDWDTQSIQVGAQNICLTVVKTGTTLRLFDDIVKHEQMNLQKA